MRALCWHGKGDVRVDTVPDPKSSIRATPLSKSPPVRFAVPIYIFLTDTSRRWRAATFSVMRIWVR